MPYESDSEDCVEPNPGRSLTYVVELSDAPSRMRPTWDPALR